MSARIQSLDLNRCFGSILALVAAASCASQAVAQSSPSAYTYATRFDLLGRIVGTIAPDPDGGGGLGYQAVRNTYDAAGRLVKVESGELSSWFSETTAPASWSGFTIY